jgi:putative ABC transport system substrate-binding protein
MSYLGRRNFIGLLGGAAAWPLAARAQQERRAMPIVGLVSIGASASDPGNFRQFIQEMGRLGYVDGQNILLDRRFAAGHDELIAGYVAELVRRPVDVIVVTGTRESIAAKQATASIPIVTIVNPDPIGMGLAQSLARPGGNLTGLTTMDFDIYGKRLELLKQAVPAMTRAAVLVSHGKPYYRQGTPWAGEIEAAARSLRVTVEIVEADESDLDETIARLAARGTQGLVVTSDGIFFSFRKDLAESTIRYRLPAILPYRQQVADGGLIAYAARVGDLSRRAASFVDRILKGAKPAELPIERPSRFELIINLRTAKAMLLELPAALLAQADEVIE